MQIKKTVETSINLELIVDENGKLETYNEWGNKEPFTGYSVTDYLEQLPQGMYEVTITAKLIED